MCEISLYFSLVDGSGFNYKELNNKELIESIIGNDIRPPVKNMAIKLETDDEIIYTINIPNDESKRGSIRLG